LNNIEKERIDLLLVRKGFFSTREKAQRAIMAGEISVDGTRVDKVGQKFVLDSTITHLKRKPFYVSRGGEKLAKALDVFSVAIKGKIIIDVGASTGGFTDCLLRSGAQKVYCVDVGYGQLDWKLRQDSRVIIMDRTNARFLSPDKFNHLFDLATIDVSFISLEKILPAIYSILKEKGEVIALIKPQFEAGPELVQKGGVVKNLETHQLVLQRVTDFVRKIGFKVRGLTFSPLRGSAGNIEFFIYLLKDNTPEEKQELPIQIKRVVELAHQNFFKEKDKNN